MDIKMIYLPTNVFYLNKRTKFKSISINSHYWNWECRSCVESKKQKKQPDLCFKRNEKIIVT